MMIMGKTKKVSTHSRPKAAAGSGLEFAPFVVVSTHSRPKAAARAVFLGEIVLRFQLTAARRRLQ